MSTTLIWTDAKNKNQLQLRLRGDAVEIRIVTAEENACSIELNADQRAALAHWLTVKEEKALRRRAWHGVMGQ